LKAIVTLLAELGWSACRRWRKPQHSTPFIGSLAGVMPAGFATSMPYAASNAHGVHRPAAEREDAVFLAGIHPTKAAFTSRA
jgi:hypothetical protein